MVWYVAIVSVLNLLLGYALGVHSAGKRATETATNTFDRDNRSAPSTVVASVPAEEVEQSTDEPTEAITASTEPVAATQAETVGEPATDSSAAASALATREYAEQLLAQLVADEGGQSATAIALVEVDETDQLAETLDERLLHGVANTVRELLSNIQTMARYGDQRLLVMLPRDDISQATQRTEQVRQRVAANEYVADGQGIKATVTCALADVSANHSVSELLKSLEATLDEAKRSGGNRTFVFDGTAPAPVAAAELNFSTQQCTI